MAVTDYVLEPHTVMDTPPTAGVAGPVRILHLLRSANPADGGPIEAVTRLALEMTRNQCRVELLALDPPDAGWLRNFPIPVHALGPVWTKYGYTRRLAPWLRQHAATFDMVVVNGIWQYHSFAVWRAVRSTSTPYVVFTHGMLDPWFKRRYPLKHVKKWLYWPWAEYRVMRDAAAVMFTCEEERQLARESFWLYRCREHVINYGTERPPDERPGQRERFFQRFPSLAGKRLLLFIGRIHEKKGCDLLVRALAAALRSAPPSERPWHLVLAGPAPIAWYRRRVEELIARAGLREHVTWTGMLMGDDKWGAFHTADAFVLPSHQENFGVAVAEALGCGVPVLVSDKVNIWREIAGSGAGMVEPDTQDGTDRLLARWMSLDAESQRRMGENAVRCFTEYFDVRNTAAHLASVIEQLTMGAGR